MGVRTNLQPINPMNPEIIFGSLNEHDQADLIYKAIDSTIPLFKVNIDEPDFLNQYREWPYDGITSDPLMSELDTMTARQVFMYTHLMIRASFASVLTKNNIEWTFEAPYEDIFDPSNN